VHKTITPTRTFPNGSSKKITSVRPYQLEKHNKPICENLQGVVKKIFAGPAGTTKRRDDLHT
jgi:hypothetical protein